MSNEAATEKVKSMSMGSKKKGTTTSRRRGRKLGQMTTKRTVGKFHYPTVVPSPLPFLLLLSAVE